ncbi:MAG: alpha/beta hydrolase, partial [Candidatus Dadabacteria bacterium]
AGYRCYLPYMRGYGETDPDPNDDYFAVSLAEDATGLAEAFGNGEPVTLIGHDWGAVATYAAAVHAPAAFERIVAMAVPPTSVIRRNLLHDPAQLRRSWYMFFFQAPLLSEYALMANDFALIERLWRDWSPGWLYPEWHIDSVKGTFRTPGTPRRALLYYRCMIRPPMPSQKERYRMSFDLLTRHAIQVPSLVIAGRRDGCLGIRMYDGWQRAFSGPCRFEVIEDAGHFVQAERPDVVARRILDWAG